MQIEVVERRKQIDIEEQEVGTGASLTDWILTDWILTDWILTDWILTRALTQP